MCAGWRRLGACANSCSDMREMAHVGGRARIRARICARWRTLEGVREFVLGCARDGARWGACANSCSDVRGMAYVWGRARIRARMCAGAGLGCLRKQSKIDISHLSWRWLRVSKGEAALLRGFCFFVASGLRSCEPFNSVGCRAGRNRPSSRGPGGLCSGPAELRGRRVRLDDGGPGAGKNYQRKAWRPDRRRPTGWR